MSSAGADEIRTALLLEHDKLLARLGSWRSATAFYRGANIVLFLMCKLMVPTGALIVAIEMIATVVATPFLGNVTAAIIAVVITFLASLEAMLNPGAKKRLAFSLNNELASIEYKLRLSRISDGDGELRDALVSTDAELKRLLNHYSENGY